ncbi:hypothetical protein HDV57DRAFT_80966 [Trichoderma longibrachiatum]
MEEQRTKESEHHELLAKYNDLSPSPQSAASLDDISEFNRGPTSSSAPIRPIVKIIQGKARRGARIYDGGENAKEDCGRVLDNQRKRKKSGECCRQGLRQISIPPPWPAEQAKHKAPVYHGSRRYQQQKHFARALSLLKQDRMPLVPRRPGFTRLSSTQLSERHFAMIDVDTPTGNVPQPSSSSEPLLNCFGMILRVAVNPQAAKVWHIGDPLSSRSVAC